MSEKQMNYTDVPKPETSGDDIVQQKKTRILDNVAKIVTLFIAFLFWLYVFATNDATKVEEKTFALIPIEVRGGETLEGKDLAIQNMNCYNIDVTLKGTRAALSGVKASDIKAYVIVSDVMSPGEYHREIYYDIPTGLSDAPMDNEFVMITVDTVVEASFTIDHNSVFVGNFSIPTSCGIDYDKITLNAASVTIEGPNMVIDRVHTVRVSARETLTLDASSTLSCTVEALDANGESVNISSCKVIVRGQNGNIVDVLTATVPLYEEKTLPVTIREKNGYVASDLIALSVTEVKVRSTPDKMKNLTAIELESFSASELASANGTAAFAAAISQKYNGYTILDANGEVLTAIDVTVSLSENKTVTLPKSCVKLVGGTAEILLDSFDLTLRATSGNEGILTKFISEAADGNPDVKIFVDLIDKKIDSECEIGVTVDLGDQYEGKIYAVGKYSITVQPIAQ